MTFKGVTFLLAAFVIFCNTEYARASSEMMKGIAVGFGQALDECKTELNIGDEIMKDMYNFWKEEYDLVNRDLGCLIGCMTKKHNLVADDGKLHHDNAAEFAMKHGADETTAKKLVEIIHVCEKASEGQADPCVMVLEVAKCFRKQIHELKWAPNFQEIIGEVMADQGR